MRDCEVVRKFIEIMDKQIYLLSNGLTHHMAGKGSIEVDILEAEKILMDLIAFRLSLGER